MDLDSILFTPISSTTILLVFGVIFAFVIVMYWRLFDKMGEPGWYSLIPFFSQWVMCKHVFGSGLWMFAAFIPIVNYIFPLVQLWKTYRCCDKGTLFCLLGLFFSPICLAICAFDDSYFTDGGF